MIYYSDSVLTIRNMEEADARIFTDGEIAQGWQANISKYLTRLSDQAEGKCVALTAVYEGHPAGYINVYRTGLGGAFRGEDLPEIVDFGVLEKYRRRGIGSRLMDAAEQIAGQYADTVWLGVGLHSGYGSAQRMYVKRGYVPDGTGVWYQGKPCAQYDTEIANDDDLQLFFSKRLERKTAPFDAKTHRMPVNRSAGEDEAVEYVFETEHLRVRKFEREDAENLYRIHLDGEVQKWIPEESYQDLGEARDAAAFYADCAAQKKLPFVLAVELKQTGELIGDTGINEVEGKPEEVEIGFVIRRESRSKGYATELCRAMTAYAVKTFHVRALYGRVMRGNGASARVLEKSGYSFAAEEAGAEDDPYGNGMLVYKKERNTADASFQELFT